MTPSTRGGRVLACALWASALCASAVSGQSVAGGALFQMYTFGDPQAAGVDRLTLLTLPWGASVPLGSVAVISADGAWARGEATSAGGQSATLSGLTDTNVALTLGLGPEWLVIVKVPE